MRAFFAKQKSLSPVLLGTATTALFVGLVFALWQTSLGLYALPLAGSVSAIALVIALIALLAAKEDGPETGALLSTLAKSLVASALFALATWAIVESPLGSLSLSNKLLSVLSLLVLAIPGGAIYLFATKKMGMKEASYLDRAWARLSRRNPSDAPSAPSD
jgi:peptidoglycan biosynthesis protein MviN/MurJ (putative lipid II flippase)